MPHDPALADRLRAALGPRAGLVEKRMFGGVCWMLGGHMLCGVESDRFMFRVGREHEVEALARPGASPMDFTGRPMRGFVTVEGSKAHGDALRGWIALAERFVRTLPPR